MPRRLTALLALLLMLPSIIVGGGRDCVMGSVGTSGVALGAAGERGHEPHLHGAEMTSARHAAHGAAAAAVSEGAESHAPIGLPHAPAQCVSVAACGVAEIVAQRVVLDSPPRAADSVAADVALTPESPALGLEPPPPRV